MSKMKELYSCMADVKIAHDHMGVALAVRLRDAKDEAKMRQLIDDSIPDDLITDFKGVIKKMKKWEKEALDNLPFE